eukprot:jgi/Galph1/5373/GphlegSOOS_G4036.1
MSRIEEFEPLSEDRRNETWRFLPENGETNHYRETRFVSLRVPVSLQGKRALYFIVLFIFMFVAIGVISWYTKKSTKADSGSGSASPLLNSSSIPVGEEDGKGALFHNSRHIVYRSPFGAVQASTPVELTISAQQNFIKYGYIRIWNHRDSKESHVDLYYYEQRDGTEFWRATINTNKTEAWCLDGSGLQCGRGQTSGNLFWYRFVIVDHDNTVWYYEQKSDALGGEGQTYDSSSDRSWVITAYDSDFQTPSWLQDAIFYHIFVERFRNGNTSNDPTEEGFFYGTTRFIHKRWNEPLMTMSQEQLEQGLASAEFYGGDLEGILEKLDYISSLGVNALYLSPIFESPSNHGYDTIDFKVAEKFGGLAAFRKLMAAAKERGFRIILDGVFNHVSSDSIYFNRYGRWPNGACLSLDSPYREWFQFFHAIDGPCIYSQEDGIKTSANYQSWFGFDTLPVLDSSSSSVRDFIWKKGGNNSIATRWILEGIDGWRLDVANEIDPGLDEPENGYWHGFRQQVLSLQPDTYIVGEYWGDALVWTVGNAWDATMNYVLGNAVIGFWLEMTMSDTNHKLGWNPGPIEPLTPSQLDRHIKNYLEIYPPVSIRAMLNILGSHDTNRLLFLLDPNTHQKNPELYQNPEYNWNIALQRLVAAIALQMSLPGAPCIFYGDEVGLVGVPRVFDGEWQSDPANRVPFPWLDEKTSGTPFYRHLKSEANMNSISEKIKRSIKARKDHESLRTGEFYSLLVDDVQGIYCFLRLHPSFHDFALVALRKSNDSKVKRCLIDTTSLGIQWVSPNQRLEDILRDASYQIQVDEDGMVSFELEPISVAIFVPI